MGGGKSKRDTFAQRFAAYAQFQSAAQGGTINNKTPQFTMKSKGLAYLLWCGGFIWLCGLQYFYIGKWVKGFLFLFTLGFLGIGQFISLFTLGGEVDSVNALFMGRCNLNANNNMNSQNIVINVPGNAQTPQQPAQPAIPPTSAAQQPGDAAEK